MLSYNQKKYGMVLHFIILMRGSKTVNEKFISSLKLFSMLNS